MNYESHIYSTLKFTQYPFLNKNDVPTSFIVGLQIVVDEIFYISECSPTKITFKNVIGDTTYSCNHNGRGVWEFDIGYIEIDTNIKTTYTLDYENGCLLYGVNLCSAPTEIIGRYAIQNGYNVGYNIENNMVECVSNLGAGLGEYCGTPIDNNYIYTLNGHAPDKDGIIYLEEAGFVRIKTFENDNDIYFQTIIPTDLCIRSNGFKGLKGEDGPTGVSGTNGLDAVAPNTEFDAYCNGE